MKTITIASFCLLALTFAACAERTAGGTTETDAGMTAGSDETPPPESAAWACRGGKDSVGDYFECNPADMDADTSLTPTWVGACPSESVNEYWSGAKKTAQLNTNGWWRLYLAGTASDCELTVSQCTDLTNPHCWMQYGLSTFPAMGAAGPYRTCGADHSCAMKLQRVAGHTPTPLGNM